MKIVQQGLYIHGKDGGTKGGNPASFFVLVVSDLTGSDVLRERTLATALRKTEY